MQPYQPISREVYEELEVRAAFQQLCTIRYRADNGGLVSLQTRFRLLKEEDAEFALLENGRKFRLDHLVSVDDLVLEHWA